MKPIGRDRVRRQVTSCSRWTAAQLAGIAHAERPDLPVIDENAASPVLPDFYLWDIWPLQGPDGTVARIAGGSLWMVLSAPRNGDPDSRHDVARTRLLFSRGGVWRDCGPLFPDGLNPGSREWSGSAVLASDGATVTAYFTAAGRRGESSRSFEQRLFQVRGRLDLGAALPAIGDWEAPVQSVVNDGSVYVDVTHDGGDPKRIRGFRDPGFFRDPADGAEYLLFTGSLAGSASRFDGVIGLACAEQGAVPFRLLPPIVSAEGLASELERPHMLVRDGYYYLFWSTQRSVFAPDVPAAPTGLYGMAGRAVRGPFIPLNGTGLVLGNPASEPDQTYCWQVLPSGDVISFIDRWGKSERRSGMPERFGGTIAPEVRIVLEGERSRLVVSGS